MQPLIPQGYEVPASSGSYMRFEEGQNRFRILMSALLTWTVWEDDGQNNKTVKRYPYHPNQRPPGKEVNHCWNLLVLDYKQEKVAVLEVNQKTIQEAIATYTRMPGYDNYLTYDFIVTRTGSGMRSKYTIMATMPSQVPLNLAKEIELSLQIANMEVLFNGGDPLNPTPSGHQLANQQAAPQYQQQAPAWNPNQQVAPGSQAAPAWNPNQQPNQQAAPQQQQQAAPAWNPNQQVAPPPQAAPAWNPNQQTSQQVAPAWNPNQQQSPPPAPAPDGNRVNGDLF